MEIASAPELDQLRSVLLHVCAAIRENLVIRLPESPSSPTESTSDFALHQVGVQKNPFGGKVGDYRYQFEGEDDLLHLFILRIDSKPISPEEGRLVAATIFAGVPPALIWFKPGEFSQHFYIGHDDLLASLEIAGKKTE